MKRCLTGRGAAPKKDWAAPDRCLLPPRCWGRKAPGKGQPDILGGADPRPSSLAETEFANSALEFGSDSSRKNLPLPPPTPPATASPTLFSLHQPSSPFPQGPPAMSDPDIPRGPDAPTMWPPCSRGA
ncbi:Vacuolar Protein Sorting-Associated Protein 13D [Manis pentadactyla]|nr:Vacuolar Protein Sorting-Associated Protein 13D [Manis pentadactyla]